MSESSKQRIGLHVQAARNRLGLTQEALAARIDRTVEALSNIERGRSYPSVDTFFALSRELGVPIAEFFEQDAAPVSVKRLSFELQLRELGRALPDRELEIAVAQLRVLAAAAKAI